MECWAMCIPSSRSGEMLSVKFLLWSVTANLHSVVQWESGGEEDTVLVWNIQGCTEVNFSEKCQTQESFNLTINEMHL